MSLSKADKDDVREIVREETTGMRMELTRIGGLLESLEDQFKTVVEAISESLKFTRSIDNHTQRITKLETDNSLTKRTVIVHSRQLKTLTGN
jgi:NADH:ubiquinone oxidoreductase subunit D